MALLITIPLTIFQQTTCISAVIMFCQRTFRGSGVDSPFAESIGRIFIINWGIMRIMRAVTGSLLLDKKEDDIYL
jgi:hypothetical protein